MKILDRTGQPAFSYALALIISLGALQGCDSSSSSDDDDSSETSSDDSDSSTDTGVWIMNTDDERAPYIYENDSNEQVLVNVQSVETETVDGKEYTVVSATGVPDYEIEITQSILDGLLERPFASSDFETGSPTVSVGDIVSFGQDIGYTNIGTCDVDAGYGFWPPGLICPENVSHVGYFPVEPEPATEDCATGLGVQGYWVNGVSIYDWGDGQSVDGTWQTLAPVAEIYDVDICGGHAANGDYHHHFYSDCLADLVGDIGDDHSPIYGYTADGYAIYGPWEGEGELAESSWAVRDYDDPTSESGCGVAGERSCLLVDEYDLSQGVETTSNTGPTTSDSYTSLSGNEFTTTAGFFYEDYYWDEDLTNEGGVYLDQHNGHTDDERGYHYHLTVTVDDDGELVPAFPYTFGPRFYGKLDDQTIISECSTQ
ncbi:YHYH protein [Microbulbifer sp. TRSA001]|uniref:YHYH protein n=1 Tax=Microbulbifer sp. TRSA001 TaxID=3243381 RepID=UPI00403A5008